MTISNEFFLECPIDRTELRKIINYIYENYRDNDMLEGLTYVCNNAFMKFIESKGITTDKQFMEEIGYKYWKFEINEPNSLNKLKNTLL